MDANQPPPTADHLRALPNHGQRKKKFSWSRAKLIMRWSSIAFAFAAEILSVMDYLLYLRRNSAVFGIAAAGVVLVWDLPQVLSIHFRKRRLQIPEWLQMVVELFLFLATLGLTVVSSIWYYSVLAIDISETVLLSLVCSIRFVLFVRACRELDTLNDKNHLRMAVRTLRQRGIELNSLDLSSARPSMEEEASRRTRTPPAFTVPAATVAATGVVVPAKVERQRDPPPDEVDWTIEENFKFIMPYDIIRDDPKCQRIGPDEALAKFSATSPR